MLKFFKVLVMLDTVRLPSKEVKSTHTPPGPSSHTREALWISGGFPGGSPGQESACNVEKISVRSLGWEDPLEKGKATHSRILVWRIPWTVESMGWQRVGHD